MRKEKETLALPPFLGEEPRTTIIIEDQPGKRSTAVKPGENVPKTESQNGMFDHNRRRRRSPGHWPL